MPHPTLALSLLILLTCNDRNHSFNWPLVLRYLVLSTWNIYVILRFGLGEKVYMYF